MLDGVKIYLINIDIKRLFSILDFKSEVSINSGEINENIFIVKYNHCQITVKKNSKEENVNGLFINPHVLFTGSIHKMWNELNGIKAPNYKEGQLYKGFNGNQFGIDGVIEVRKHLESLFDCNSSQMIFENIELGVNTTPSFNPKLYLKGLLFHRDKYFDYRYNGNYAQSIHQRFTFKIYYKSDQYGMNYEVLRVELKIVKMEDLKSIEIKTFADINESTLNKVKSLLLKRFKEIAHYDYTIQKKRLSKIELRKLKDYSNPRYWIEDLKPNHRSRHKDSLRLITLNYSDKLHQQIESDIIEKCVIINRLSDNSKCVIINSECIELNITHSTLKKCSNICNKIDEVKKSFCSVTGLNISMQKSHSLLLSHTGLNYYYKTDKKIFEQVKKKYLSKRWLTADCETQIKEIAHNIRNTNSNRSIKQKRIYQPTQLNVLHIYGI